MSWQSLGGGGALLALSTAAMAGPYAPAAGLVGSTAIHRTDARIVAWGNRVTNYAVGTDCLAQWQDPTKCLGPAGDDATHITCLGAGGTITLAFPGFLKNGPGADFAIFENALNDSFLELAFVEVSRDGVNFVRFPNHSATPALVSTYGALDPTNLQGLGCKYRQPYGEPYDLSDVGLDEVAYVRLVDIIGTGSARDSENRPIYDPYPNTGSAGFDLDAIGVLNLTTWQTQHLGTLLPDQTNATAFAHLPDGRLVLGSQGVLSVQSAWGQPARTIINAGTAHFDPSFIAIGSATQALLGEGGGFGASTGVDRFNPSLPSLAIVSPPLANLQNFSGTWWQSSLSTQQGWIIGGGNGPTGKHRLSYLSTDGAVRGFLTTDLSTYSSGLTADAQGNIYYATYELEGSPQAAQSEWVRKFSVAQIDAAVANLAAPLSATQSTPIFQFDSASALAVDALGRVWASGFKVSTLQVYDPNTGAMRRLAPAQAAFSAGTDVLYQVQTFTKAGEGYVAYLASDEAGTPGSSLVHGLTPLGNIAVPETLATWLTFHHISGAQADPDHDGIVNLLEYAFNTDPLSPQAEPWQLGKNAGGLTLTFSADSWRTDLRYTVEASDNLQSWQIIALNGRAVSTTAHFLRVRITEVTP